MKSVKVILPVAGSGTRLRPHTLTKPKVLLPIAGKPMLQYIIDELVPHKIDEYLYIIGHLGEHIKEFITHTYQVKSRFVQQEERLGLGHAIHLSMEYVHPKDELLIILGDTLFEFDLNAVFKSERSLIGVKEVSDPSRFGVVQLEKGVVARFVEKPTEFVSNLAIVGIYYIRNAESLMKALVYIIEHKMTTKGEFQLTDALQHMVSKGHSFGVIPVDGWFDCGKPETLLATNQHFLSKLPSEAQGLDPGITPPCFIGKSVALSNATIGPYVSIGDGCTIENSTISNTIVYDNAHISDSNIKDSIIGSNAVVKGCSRILNIGDFTTIEGQ